MADQQNDSSRQSTPSRQTPPKSTTPNHGGINRNSGNRKGLPLFNSYMSLFQVQEKLKKGEVIEVRNVITWLMIDKMLFW